MSEVICEQCGRVFKKSKYDIKRTNNNFCSRDCHNIFQTTKKEVRCVNCGNAFLKLPNQIKKTGNNFCSRSCTAKYNNKKYPKRIKVKKITICVNCGDETDGKKYCTKDCKESFHKKRYSSNCLNCKKVLYNPKRSSKKKFCDSKCMNNYRYTLYISDWLCGKNDGTQKNSGQISRYIVKYLREYRGEKCEECGWNKINKYTGRIPLGVHHIDGDDGNNRPENLQLLCGACHTLTPNYCGSNKGSGNSYRSKYYKSANTSDGEV